MQTFPIIINQDIDLKLAVSRIGFGIGFGIGHRIGIRIRVWIRIGVRIRIWIGIRVRVRVHLASPLVDVAQDRQLVAPHGDADVLRHDPIDRVVGGGGAPALKVDMQVRGVDIGRWAE